MNQSQQQQKKNELLETVPSNTQSQQLKTMENQQTALEDVAAPVEVGLKKNLQTSQSESGDKISGPKRQATMKTGSQPSVGNQPSNQRSQPGLQHSQSPKHAIDVHQLDKGTPDISESGRPVP